jgi:hypothetical protein
MPNPRSGTAEQRGKIIKLLEDALILADDLEDGNTGYLKWSRLSEQLFRVAKWNLCRG